MPDRRQPGRHRYHLQLRRCCGALRDGAGGLAGCWGVVWITPLWQGPSMQHTTLTSVLIFHCLQSQRYGASNSSWGGLVFDEIEFYVPCGSVPCMAPAPVVAGTISSCWSGDCVTYGWAKVRPWIHAWNFASYALGKGDMHQGITVSSNDVQSQPTLQALDGLTTLAHTDTVETNPYIQVPFSGVRNLNDHSDKSSPFILFLPAIHRSGTLGKRSPSTSCTISPAAAVPACHSRAQTKARAWTCGSATPPPLRLVTLAARMSAPATHPLIFHAAACLRGTSRPRYVCELLRLLHAVAGVCLSHYKLCYENVQYSARTPALAPQIGAVSYWRR